MEKSKRHMVMEVEILNYLVPHKESTMYNLGIPEGRVKFSINLLRNLHKSTHCGSCFKKGLECRMHIPSPQRQETVVELNKETLLGTSGLVYGRQEICSIWNTNESMKLHL
jgi:hypothetical protein